MFYISLGAAAGVVAVRRAARLASALTPESVAGSLVASVKEFTADVREGMAEREAELRGALGIIDGDDDDEDAHRHPRYEGADDVTATDLAASNGRRAS
ncbi:MAG: DUF6167 family protein [Frankia sp.]